MSAQIKAVPAQTDSSLTLYIDEFTELHEQVKAFESTQKRYDELKKLLATYADEHGSDAEVRLSSKLGYIVFSKAPMTRTINDIGKFFVTVGLESFLGCVTVSTTKADKLLDAKQKAELFEVSNGSRRLKDCARISSVLLGGLAIVKS